MNNKGFCDSCQNLFKGSQLNYMNDFGYLFCDDCVLDYVTSEDVDIESDETGRFKAE